MRCIVCTNTSLMTFKQKQEELAAHVWIYFGFSLIQTGPKADSNIYTYTTINIWFNAPFVAINKLLNSFWLDI